MEKNGVLKDQKVLEKQNQKEKLENYNKQIRTKFQNKKNSNNNLDYGDMDYPNKTTKCN